jgi:hypothetical protein
MCMSSAAAAATPAGYSPPPGLQFVPVLQQYGTSFVGAVNAVMISLEGFMLTMAAGAVVFLLIAGVLLYYSGLGKRHGKQFMEGGVIIAVFMAFGVPYLVHAYC